MVDRGGEFSFFRGIYVRTDILIDISISMKPRTTKSGKQLHLGELTQMKLIKQVLVLSSRKDHVKRIIWRNIQTFLAKTIKCYHTM